MEKIIAVYKIVNEVTGDFYIGSSKDVMRRFREHKQPLVWKKQSNNPMYQDLQKSGVEHPYIEAKKHLIQDKNN